MPELPDSVDWPVRPASPFDPPPVPRSRESLSKITLWDGRKAWLITRFADAREALLNSCLSADATDPNFPSMNPSQVVPNHRGGPARTADPRHNQIRRMVADEFTVQAAQELRPAACRIADALLDDLLAGDRPADLLARFAVPLPVRLICRVVGVPAEEAGFVEDYGRLVASRLAELSRPATDTVRGYVADLMARKERAPADDLVSRLVHRFVRPGDLGRTELVDLLVVVLVAGHTTTASTIALGALSLLQDPEMFRALRADPALADSMVEEFLRYHTVVSDGAPRVAKEDLTVAGTLIRAGDAVVISLASANRDEEVFDHPDQLDIRRDARRQLGFGYGAHRCLGQHLARMELRTAFSVLAVRMPRLRLAVPVEELRMRHDGLLRGLLELPVSW
jgi:cytochrome P450